LGAAGLGEIGLFFPPGDPKTKGISSADICRKVRDELAARNASIVNVDAAVVAEAPKLKPYYERFASSIASLFELPRDRVNVKAKSHEGLGELGRGEAIACHAVASVVL
jgi:2-C-methyl-D-erythritol 2,4-cyclodiphosphate synthase